jgi:4Fe-4S ferredoxin, iron-sulfur binding domain protein
MQSIKKIKAVFFSPTGNTQQAVELIAARLAQKFSVPVEVDDFTLPAAHVDTRTYSSEDVVVFGVPTYAGRIPNKVLPFVQTLFKGNQTRAIAVVTFGNRSFDNSLSELASELEKNHFSVVAAGAVVCKHAFAEIGIGRPDTTDQERIAAFADTAFEKLQKSEKPLPNASIKRNEALTAYYVPLGTDGKPVNFLKAKPVTDKAKCDNCGVCAAVCPMGSIDKNDVSLVPGICIKCQACIVKCHTKAKFFDDPLFLSHKAMLERNYTRAAVSEFFA